MHVEVSVEDVKSCFVPCFSTARTELHEKETEIVYKLHSFLRNVKNGKLKCYVYPFSEATLPGTCDAELRVLA